MQKIKQTGFTIVELLIVIVVIAILAAVTVVAFNGVQARANDSAVQAYITQLYKKIQLAKESGELTPENLEQIQQAATGVSASGLDPQQDYPIIIAERRLHATQHDSGPATYEIAAVSKSGNVFYIAESTGGTGKALVDWADKKSWLNEYLDALVNSPEQYSDLSAEEINLAIEQTEAELARIARLEGSGEYGWRADSDCSNWTTYSYVEHEPDYPCIKADTHVTPLIPGYPFTFGGYLYSPSTNSWSTVFHWS